MTQDKRDELIWQMLEAAKEYEAVPLAIGPRAMEAALDIALKAAAEIAKEIERQQEIDCGAATPAAHKLPMTPFSPLHRKE